MNVGKLDSAKGTAALLGLRRPWLEQEAARGRLPATVIDGKYWFDPGVVAIALQARAGGPVRLSSAAETCDWIGCSRAQLRLLAEVGLVPSVCIGQTGPPAGFDLDAVNDSLWRLGGLYKALDRAREISHGRVDADRGARSRQGSARRWGAAERGGHQLPDGHEHEDAAADGGVGPLPAAVPPAKQTDGEVVRGDGEATPGDEYPLQKGRVGA